MSIRVVVEVMDHAPDHLTASERWLLVCLAEQANDATRECWPGAEQLVRRMRVQEWDAVAKVIRSLAGKGIELRVPIRNRDGSDRVDSQGRPVYAATGRQSMYRLPQFAPVSA